LAVAGVKPVPTRRQVTGHLTAQRNFDAVFSYEQGRTGYRLRMPTDPHRYRRRETIGPTALGESDELAAPISLAACINLQ
jgi:hypothetical protein